MERAAKGYANAITLLAVVLFRCQIHSDDYRIVSINGGEDALTVASSASAVIVHNGPSTVEYMASYMKGLFDIECINCEENLTVTTETLEYNDLLTLPMDRRSTRAILTSLIVNPNGEQRMTCDPNGEECIFSNPGNMYSEETVFNVKYGIMSSVPSQGDLAIDRIKTLFDLFGGTTFIEKIKEE